MPDKELSQEKLNQLDSNIRKMISAGASKEDVDRYTADFRNQFATTPAPTGPVPAAQTGLPTFQEQQRQLTEYQRGKYEKALEQDRERNKRLIADVYDSMIKNTPIVPGAGGGKYIAAMIDQFGSALEPIQYLADEAFITAKGLLSGKLLNAQEKMAERAILEGQRQVGMVPRLTPPKLTPSEYRERLASNMDLTDGIGGDDIKALGLVGSRVAGDLAVAVAGQAAGIPMGTTYYLQAYGGGLKDYDETVSSKDLPSNEVTRQAYANSVGFINSKLEKYGFDKIFGRGPAFKNIQRKVLADLLNNSIKAEGKIAVDMLEKTADDMVKNLIKRPDIIKKAVSSAGIEAATEGIQSGLDNLSKLLSNQIQGQEIFNEEDVKKNFWKNVGNEAIAGGILGGAMGASTFTISPEINNTLISDIAAAKTDEDINRVALELDDTLNKNNVSDEQKQLIFNNMKRYRDIKQTIPQEMPDDKKTEIINLIDRRYQLDNQITQSKSVLENVDEAFKGEKESELKVLEDGRALINDEIKQVSTGGKYNYFEQDGKYYKQFQEETPEEITQEYYNLSKVKEQAYATTESEKPVQEGRAEGDISQRERTQEEGAQGAPIEADTGDSNISRQEGPQIAPVVEAPRVTIQPTYGKITPGQKVQPATKGKLQKKVTDDASRVVNSIRTVVKNMTGNEPEVNLHDNNSFSKAVIEAGGTQEESTSRAFYMGTDGTIHINMDNVASDTALHEGFHPILDFLEKYNPSVVDQLVTQLQSIPESAPIIEGVNALYQGYYTRQKEAITEFVAGVADGRIQLNPSNFQRIKSFILDMLAQLGLGSGGQRLMKVNNESDLIRLANFVTEKFRAGQEITTEALGDFIEVKPTKENPVAKSGQLQFQKTIYSNSKIEKAPALDRAEFKRAVSDGRISVVNPYQSLKDKFFAITFPDDFFTGEIKYDNQTIAFGNGGVFFAARFGVRGDLWAAAGEVSARNFVIQGNESLQKNNGEGIIVLSKGDDIKHATSLEANIAFINTVIEYAGKNKQLAPVVKAIKQVYTVGGAKSAESIIDSFNQFLTEGRGESGQRMVDAKVAFDTMASALIKEAGPTMTKMLRDMGFDGPTYFNKTKLAKGEYVATTQGLKAMYADLLQEDFLKGMNVGSVYAALKFTSPLKYEKDPYHPSYPFVIRTVDGSPIKLEVFTKTFNSYGKEGVAIYGKDRNNENAFGVTTTTKPDYKLDSSFEDNPAQNNLSDKLNQYNALKGAEKVKPQSQTIEEARVPQFQKSTAKNIEKFVVDKAKDQFRFGLLGKKNIEFLESREGEVAAELKNAENSVVEALNLLNKYKNVVTVADVRRYMTGKSVLTKFPDDLAVVLSKMRGHIDGMTDRLIQLGVMNTKVSADAISWKLADGKYLISAKEITEPKEEGEKPKEEVILEYDDLDAEKLIEVLGEEKANLILSQEGNEGELKQKGLTVDFYKANKGSYMLRSYSSLDYKDDTVSQMLYGKGLNIDNVTKKLENVDQSVVDRALDFLAKQEKEANPELTEEQAMENARKRANEILDNAERNIMLKGLTGSVNVKSLAQRKDIDPEIRALMGEYTDPMYNYFSTIFKISSLTASRQYLNSLKQYGMGKFIFEKGDMNKPDEASSLIAAKSSDTLAPLNGLYTFPEIYEAMLNQDKEQNLLIYEIMGRIRKFKTVYNPATHVKNLIGNMGFAVSNGHWNYLPEAYQYMKAQITGGNAKELDEVMDILYRESVLNSNIGIGELRSYFDKHKNLNDFLSDIYAQGEGSQREMTLMQKAGATAKKYTSKGFKALEKAYAVEDNIFKVLAFVNEANRYAKAKYKKSFNELSPEQKNNIKKEVTNIVKDTYPTFTRVPKIVKTFSKAFFMGNFLSFPIESVRVSYNTLALAKKEIKSKNPELVKAGVTRLSGTLAYNAIFSSLVYYSLMAAKAGATGLLGYLRGDDEDESEKAKAIRYNVVPYARNNDVFVSKFKDGILEYIDFGSLDSYNYQKRVWNAFWSNINDKKGFDKAMADAVGQALDPWLTTDFVVRNFMNISANDDGRGNMIYNPEGNALDKYIDITKYISKQMAPGFIGAGVKIADYYNRGEYQKAKDEIKSQFFARKYTTNLEKQFTNYIYADYSEMDENVGFKDRLNNARQLYMKAKRNNVEGEALEDIYKDAVRQYKDILKTASHYYNYAIEGGANADNLYSILSKSRIGSAEISGIVSQDFEYDDEAYIPRD